MLTKSLLITTILGASAYMATAQTPSITSMSVATDSCYGISAQNVVHLYGYVSNPVAGLSVDFYWGDGSTTSASFSPNNYFNGGHVYATPGTYTIAVVLMDGTTAVDTMYRTVDAFCSIVKGEAYKRADNNCDRDYTTEHLVNSTFDIEVRKAGVPVDTITSNGYIYKKIQAADLTSVFSLHPINLPAGVTLACPVTPYQFKFDTLDYQTFDGFEYAFDCDPSYTGFDFSVTGLGYFRPVSNSYITFYPRNASCVGTNAQISLDISPKYSFVSSNVTPTSVTGNHVVWDMAGLDNTGYPFITVTLNAVGTLTLGDTVMSHLNITPTAGDVNPLNNQFLLVDSIRASWDPNEKHVSPLKEITQGELLTYTIHFENLGNDTAFNIHILDELSAHVDASSFKAIASSHPMSTQIIESNGGKTLRVDFPNIHLADASSPDHNKGFITYQINARTGLPLGTTINNTADIYFDINPAIVTNTTTNIIPNPNSIADWANAKRMSIYPNPTNDILFIEGMEQFKQIHIINAMGQQVSTHNVKAGTNNLPVARLAPGLYFLKATGNDGIYMQKFVKQ
jgi:uncharacterized repeat protein (TIGR01451 family)